MCFLQVTRARHTAPGLRVSLSSGTGSNRRHPVATEGSHRRFTSSGPTSASSRSLDPVSSYPCRSFETACKAVARISGLNFVVVRSSALTPHAVAISGKRPSCNSRAEAAARITLAWLPRVRALRRSVIVEDPGRAQRKYASDTVAALLPFNTHLTALSECLYQLRSSLVSPID